MQTEEKVRERFDELYERELRKKKKEFLSCDYRNCRYNTRYKVKGNGFIGFCLNPKILSKTKHSMRICNDAESAKACSEYQCLHIEESITRKFHDELKSPSICGKKYPKLAVLLWFLQQIPNEGQSRWERFQYHLRECFWSLFTKR